MPLTDSERERTKYHLGYLGVGTAASLQFGIPRPIETLFLVETAMDHLLAISVPRVQRLLTILDGIEETKVEGISRLAASKLDDITLRADEQEALDRQYCTWADRLADVLGVPEYPYSRRFQGVATGGVGNVRVSG